MPMTESRRERDYWEKRNDDWPQYRLPVPDAALLADARIAREAGEPVGLDDETADALAIADHPLAFKSPEELREMGYGGDGVEEARTPKGTDTPGRGQSRVFGASSSPSGLPPAQHAAMEAMGWRWPNVGDQWVRPVEPEGGEEYIEVSTAHELLKAQRVDRALNTPRNSECEYCAMHAEILRGERDE